VLTALRYTKWHIAPHGQIFCYKISVLNKFYPTFAATIKVMTFLDAF